MRISKKQVALAQVARRQLGMEDADYRALLKREAGVTSTTDIDREDFPAVLARFRALGFEQRDRKGRARRDAKDHGWRRDMATPAQVDYIRGLWSDYTDGEGDDRSLGTWLSRTFRVSDIKFLPDWQGRKVITALRKMIDRKDGSNANV